jgi:hypothetical protein
MLPSAISSSKRGLPTPRLTSTTAISGSTILPSKPTVLPSAIDALRMKPTSNVIEHIKSDIVDIKDKPKVGRPTKIEKIKEAKKTLIENIHSLISRNPGKKDIRLYFQSRIKELS